MVMPKSSWVPGRSSHGGQYIPFLWFMFFMLSLSHMKPNASQIISGREKEMCSLNWEAQLMHIKQMNTAPAQLLQRQQNFVE